jgi:DNA helicase IV
LTLFFLCRPPPPPKENRVPNEPSDPLAREQTHLDKLYQRLDELRGQARDRLERVRLDRAGGSPQNRSERDSFAALYSDRLAQLNSVEDRLCFGALSMTDGEWRYIGRIGMTDDAARSLLTDWRAPAAEPFYQATPEHRMAVRLRRHISTHARQVTAIDDELLDVAAAGTQDANLSGEGALMAALATERTGRMGDIVATIQAEQDRIIRSDLHRALVVQGGPGTGKTAVALHRAAFLLYQNRERLASSGVLVVGPSRIFLRYIERVLPSLGETGVVTSTISDLVPGVRVTASEYAEKARVKGKAIMAQVVRRAVRERQRLPQRDLRLRVGSFWITLTRRDVIQAREAARATHRLYNAARGVFVAQILDILTPRLAQAEANDPAAVPDAEERARIREDLRAARDVRVACNLCWMPLTPTRLIEDLYANGHVLAACAPELSERERQLLYRPSGSPWTQADVPLIDEAWELLGEDPEIARAAQARAKRERASEVSYARRVLANQDTPIRIAPEVLADRFAPGEPTLTLAERAAEDRSWAYGHVVVDEAQELSPMEWRMLLRRCPTHSMTIVGDMGQAHAPGAARTWAQALDPVLGQGTWRLEQLTVNYRTPKAVMDQASAMAQAAGLPVGQVLSAREVPHAYQIEAVEDPVARAREYALELAPAGVSGRLALIAPAGQVAAVRAALAASPIAGKVARAGDNPLDTPVAVLAAHEAKGLEFDDVVIVDPVGILTAPLEDLDVALTDDDGAAARRAGAGDLYVAMTRPTRYLKVLARGQDAPPCIVELVKQALGDAQSPSA